MDIIMFQNLKKIHNLHNNPEENQIKISRVFICTDVYANTFRGKRNHINIYRLQITSLKWRLEKLVARCRARGCEGNLKVVNTKILCSVKKCKRLLYYKSLILQNQKVIQLLPIYDDKNWNKNSEPIL